MRQSIEVGDLVIFNPRRKCISQNQKKLADKSGQVAYILTPVPRLGAYLISFDLDLRALVDTSLVEKIEYEPGMISDNHLIQSGCFF